ncbi:Acyl-CoA synthetase (AMP-forming)/AMP-acid ligase II [Promicromonospora umidemergens]|uniref:Class I adenylate-forming enzyme family protein n=1 Tax=Promicromonospora umidemergens TaxID=629679 RepID=A0ABP8YBM3_9MICO|nr:class I adenylate-forming enzyme family protein [Promicromonospora umidemergens]MCP2285286.1 Acyl-CoA synthetase (AMP-forming)/AMP-acid ligase II [Promicromonospora umidemergens]
MKHLVDELLVVARSTPDVVALRWFGGRDGGRVREEVTFGGLAERVERTATGLRAQGMEPGDRVLFSIRPRPEGVVLCLAVLRAGGAVVFVDPGSTPELFAARIAAARPRWAATEALLHAASSGPLRGIARSRGLLLPDYGQLPVRHLYTGRWLPGVPRGAHRVARLGRALPGTVRALEAAEADREALVVFTSGTTSDPKAVVHTVRTLGGMLELFGQVGDLKPGQRAHTDQMFLGLPAIIAGGTWEIPAKAPKDAPEAFARGVAGADSSFLVPADVTALLDVLEAGSKAGSKAGPAASAAGPAVLAVGAAPVTVALLERGRRILPGTRWLAVYGATEILPAAVTDADEKIAAAAAGDLVGRPLGGIGVRIDRATSEDSEDRTDREHPTDSADPDDAREVGELVLTGPSLMAGYLSDLDAGRARAVEHRTGDLAYQDAEGRIVLVGRNRDMIIRGTVNIYPGLFEPRLRELPGVADAVLVGVPVPDGDERVVLVVTAEGGTRPGGDPEIQAGTELARSVADQVVRVLDHGALPDLVVEASHLPLAGRSRKPDRRALVNLVTPLAGTVRA